MIKFKIFLLGDATYQILKVYTSLFQTRRFFMFHQVSQCKIYDP